MLFFRSFLLVPTRLLPFLLIADLTLAVLLESTGSTLTLKGESSKITYFVPPFSVGSIQLDTLPNQVLSANGLIPITILRESANAEQLIQNFTRNDDVFSESFLQVVYGPRRSTLHNGLYKRYGVLSVVSGNHTIALPQGPYFFRQTTGEVFQAYRLYSDFAGAFNEGLIRTPNGSYISLSAAIDGSASLTIGVPSRLYYTPTADKPLAGLRVGVKDIYDIAGVKSSNGNRAFYNLYPPRAASAVAVQRLEAAGAIIVGKQKTSQFANGEEATEDWVDYHSPFSPRGDGYQDPSSSSAGAGASMASYSWLDLALGSDTGGSIRGPSQVGGLFGNRPTHGLVSLDGVMPLSPALDTAGFLTRSPSIWGRAQSVFYSGFSTPDSYPKRIVTYNFPTNSSSPVNGVLIAFLDKLQRFLAAPVSAVNLSNEWASTRPPNATSSLTSLLNITYPILISKDQAKLVRQSFYDDYANFHDGRRPFVDPAPLIRWNFGDGYPESARDEALANKTLFMNWFGTNILKQSNTTCSESLFLYVGSTATANERNQYGNPPSVPYGFSSSRISVFAETPDSVFPIGQAPFFSSVTQHTEYLPVTIDVLAAKGCDGLIVKLAQDLEKAGILNTTQVGQTIYGGDILFKRGVLDEIQEDRQRSRWTRHQ